MGNDQRCPALFLFCFLLLAPLLTSLSLAKTQALYPFTSPEKQARFEQLSAHLRCLVCKNQNIAESQAGLAKDLRQKLYTLIKSDQSDQAIKDYMTKRYGDFVLFKPPFKGTTYLLWLTPLISFIIAFVVLLVVLHQRAQKT